MKIFLHLIRLLPGGASAHPHRQPQEAGSSAVLRPWQNAGQQRSKQRLWAWGHEPARWDGELQACTTGFMYVCPETGDAPVWLLPKISFILFYLKLHESVTDGLTIIFSTPQSLLYCYCCLNDTHLTNSLELLWEMTRDCAALAVLCVCVDTENLTSAQTFVSLHRVI